jgi:GNAT superfamily N-acetyltransferase
MVREVRIREATAADGPALVRLEWQAPEAGPLAVRVEFHGDYLALGSRLGPPSVYVAEAAGGAVAGTLSAVTRRTRLGDGWAPTTYLFRLRVGPEWRRRGVAAGLVAHAWSAAQQDHDSEVAWGAILARNRASLGLARAAGFRRVRTLGFRVLPTRWPAPGRARHVVPRPPHANEWAALAAQATTLYGDCQFWPGPAAPGPDTWVWADGQGVRASAAVFDLSTLATLRATATYPGLTTAAAALARLGILPDVAARLRAGLVRDLTFAPERPADGAALVGALLRQWRARLDFLVVAGDPAHASGRVLRRLPWGLPGRVVVVARSRVPLDRGQPIYFALA